MEVLVTIFYFVFAISALGIAGGALIVYLKKGGPRPKDLALIEGRLERIEQAVDSIAVEVERISEGQRFTTKLLSDRGAEQPQR
ncbi:MAG TPA: hypothetical protein VEI06_13615 [Gemmatimonadaceae bacterium]|nr:hypothetical protein [Gemmatimonadaceae bacterium]